MVRRNRVTSSRTSASPEPPHHLGQHAVDGGLPRRAATHGPRHDVGVEATRRGCPVVWGVMSRTSSGHGRGRQHRLSTKAGKTCGARTSSGAPAATTIPWSWGRRQIVRHRLRRQYRLEHSAFLELVWSTDRGGANRTGVIWGARRPDGSIWGSADDDNIVWSTRDDDDNIVWSTRDDDDNIVWSTRDDDDNIVWSTRDDDDNIVWSTGTVGQVLWPPPPADNPRRDTTGTH